MCRDRVGRRMRESARAFGERRSFRQSGVSNRSWCRHRQKREVRKHSRQSCGCWYQGGRHECRRSRNERRCWWRFCYRIRDGWQHCGGPNGHRPRISRVGRVRLYGDAGVHGGALRYRRLRDEFTRGFGRCARRGSGRFRRGCEALQQPARLRVRRLCTALIVGWPQAAGALRRGSPGCEPSVKRSATRGFRQYVGLIKQNAAPKGSATALMRPYGVSNGG